jgi:hypothetical protein
VSGDIGEARGGCLAMKVLASLLLLASIGTAHAQRGDIQDAADDIRAFWDRPNELDDEILARRMITEEFPVFATACKILHRGCAVASFSKVA